MWTFIERHFEEIIGCLCLVAIAALIFLEVVLRYVFDTGLSWIPEIAGFCMVWMVYMGAALGVRERFHIRIFVGVMLLPGRLPAAFVILSDVVWFIFNIGMLVYGVKFLELALARTELSPDLGINMFWPETILVIGYGLITIRLIQLYWNWVREGMTGIPGLPDEYRTMVQDSQGAA